jgi:hypothetical protein
MHFLAVAKWVQAGAEEPKDGAKAERFEILNPHPRENQWFVKREKWEFIKTES